MIWTTLAFIALVLAAIPCALLLVNLGLYRPLRDHPKHDCPAVSVLIPARDEESNLRPTLDAVLANGAIDFEVIVLDDDSADSTAKIVAEYAKRDSRVRLEAAPPLPDDWCGKQHACHVLANLARNPLLVFLDADVRLAPNALVRLADYVEESDAHLVSGVPRQKLETFSDHLLLPFIHFAFGLSSAGHHATARFITGMFRRLRSTDFDTAGCLLCVRRSRRVPRRNARRPKVAACLSQRWFPHRPVRRDRSGNVPNVSNQCGGLAWAEQERH
ncbi:MAG: glycosyltransferase family 2 protein [Chthoniobacterales bacterium]|nr:glycosyltransferase family 2 protein [Chthoniobacterales bacterium]